MGTYISFGDFCKICFKSKDFKGTAECVQKKNSGIFYRRAENTVSEESKMRSGIGSAKIFRKNRHMNMKSF